MIGEHTVGACIAMETNFRIECHTIEEVSGSDLPHALNLGPIQGDIQF